MKKSDEERVTARDHKLSFDQYTGKFYFESKIEGIERTCRMRLKHTEAMNKGESLILQNQHQTFEGKMHIFDMKNSRENDTLKESLRDFVAHRNALDEVGRNNDNDPDRNDKLGRYGLNSSRKDLLPFIELEKLKMDPAWRRKKECQLLLSQRRPMDLIDRQLPTSTIMLSWRRKNKPEPKKPDNAKPMPQLILPPLKVKISTKKGTAKSVTGNMATGEEQDPETTSLPSIFITHVPKTEVMPNN